MMLWDAQNVLLVFNNLVSIIILHNSKSNSQFETSLGSHTYLLKEIL